MQKWILIHVLTFFYVYLNLITLFKEAEKEEKEKKKWIKWLLTYPIIMICNLVNSLRLNLQQCQK